MKIAIHQPHYFPWIGYFDKLAKSDSFVLLDEVQLEKGSQMVRNKVLDNNGEIKFITISGDTKNFLGLRYCDLLTKNKEEWTTRQYNALENYYRKSGYKSEILPVLSDFFSNDYQTICEWVCASIILTRDLLDIDTPLIFQSQIDYDKTQKKSDLVNSICLSMGADTYLSGRGGSVDYLDRDKFASDGISIEFQDFVHPNYKQCNSNKFIPGLSIVDMLFNCGIDNTKEIFWTGMGSE